MKKFYSIFLVALVAALALVSCNKEKAFAVSDVEALEEILFSVDDGAGTRATEVTTSNLSSMNVTATTGTSSETAVSNFSNINFTKQNTVWKGGKYWPANNPSYHFYASNATLTHTSSGNTVSPQNASTDIVVGYLANPTYKSQNSLTLNHIFAQIGTVTVNAPSGCTVSNLKISVLPKTSGTFNLKSNSWTSRGNAGSATYLVGSANSGVSITTAGGSTNGGDKDLWLVPDTYTLTASYNLSIGDYTSSTITKTSSVSLTQGANNNITATLPTDDNVSEITFTVTVTAWGTENKNVNF